MAVKSWYRSCLLLSVWGTLLAGMNGAAGDALLPGEIPTAFTPHSASFDYVKREVMIPMRDGVKLKTVILIPRGAHRAPILLTRTPYGATERIAKSDSAHLARSSTAPTWPMMRWSTAATSARCRMCAASTTPRATI